jgi:glycosyltransferase involved in cell wall biosynthesis
MRVLIAVHGFPPTHSAGAERRAERMAQWFHRQNHYVEVFTVESLSAPETQLETTMQDGYPVHRLSYNISQSEDPFINFYESPVVGKAIRKVLGQQTFDVMHIVSGYLMGKPAIDAAHEFGIPIVLTLTEYWFLCARLNLIQATGTLCNGPETIEKCTRCLLEAKRRYRLPSQAAPKLMDWLWPNIHKTSMSTKTLISVERRQTILHEALNSVQTVISPSQYLIEKFSEYGFDTSRFLFVRQGLANYPTGQSAWRPSPDGRLRVGYMGQIKEHKGVDLLVDAILAMREKGENVSLDVWGNENESPVYTKTLQSQTVNDSHIRWNGLYTGSKMWDILTELDVVVVPSRWHENSPNVILEAYKMGVPVVATNLGGMAELVEHEKYGLVFKINDAEDLRHQLERLIHQPGLIDSLRANIPLVKSIDDEMQEITVQYDHLVKSIDDEMQEITVQYDQLMKRGSNVPRQ